MPGRLGQGAGPAASRHDPGDVHRRPAQPAQQLLLRQELHVTGGRDETSLRHPPPRLQSQGPQRGAELLRVHDGGFTHHIPGAVVVDEPEETTTQETGQPQDRLGDELLVRGAGRRRPAVSVVHHRDDPQEARQILPPGGAGEGLVHAGGAGAVVGKEVLDGPPPGGIRLADRFGVDLLGAEQLPHPLRR